MKLTTVNMWQKSHWPKSAGMKLNVADVWYLRYAGDYQSFGFYLFGYGLELWMGHTENIGRAMTQSQTQAMQRQL